MFVSVIIVGTRHAGSVSALVVGHGMPCPYHASAPAYSQFSVFRFPFLYTPSHRGEGRGGVLNPLLVSEEPPEQHRYACRQYYCHGEAPPGTFHAVDEVHAEQ